MNKLLRCAAVAAALSISATASADWSIYGLGSLEGSNNTRVTDINDQGQVVGYTYLANGNWHAFVTGSDGVGMTDLGTLGGWGSIAYGINDSGQVAGLALDANNLTYAFITEPDGTGMTNLGSLGGYSEGFGINNQGQVTGNSYSSAGYHAFITGPDGAGMTDIGTLGGRTSYASGINNSGQVVGFSMTSAGFGHAFITGPNGTNMTDLGTLGGTSSFAGDINDLGQVVGSSTPYLVNSPYHAYVTGPDGVGMLDLGQFGGTYSHASGINNLGEVVGIAATADNNTPHSFLYSHGGMTDLDLLDAVLSAGWTSLNAVDINNNGQIIGTGIHNGKSEAFFLSYTSDTVFDPLPIVVSIPEPSTYAMLLAGLGLLGFVGKRNITTTSSEIR